jgi:hypothetical protein
MLIREPVDAALHAADQLFECIQVAAGRLLSELARS